MNDINKADTLITVNDLFEDDEVVLMKAFFEDGTYHYSGDCKKFCVKKNRKNPFKR